jgi:hypothetical protein
MVPFGWSDHDIAIKSFLVASDVLFKSRIALALSPMMCTMDWAASFGIEFRGSGLINLISARTKKGDDLFSGKINSSSCSRAVATGTHVEAAVAIVFTCLQTEGLISNRAS